MRRYLPCWNVDKVDLVVDFSKVRHCSLEEPCGSNVCTSTLMWDDFGVFLPFAQQQRASHQSRYPPIGLCLFPSPFLTPTRLRTVATSVALRRTLRIPRRPTSRPRPRSGSCDPARCPRRTGGTEARIGRGRVPRIGGRRQNRCMGRWRAGGLVPYLQTRVSGCARVLSLEKRN